MFARRSPSEGARTSQDLLLAISAPLGTKRWPPEPSTQQAPVSQQPLSLGGGEIERIEAHRGTAVVGSQAPILLRRRKPPTPTTALPSINNVAGSGTTARWMKSAKIW